MFAKRLVLLLTVFAAALLPAAVSHAEGTAVLSQAYARDQLAASLGLGLSGGNRTVVFIGAGGVLFGLIAVTAALAIGRGRRKKASPDARGASSGLGGGGDADKTELLGGEHSGGLLYVRLRNVDNPDQIWTHPLSAAIVIGRDPDCQVYINEGSVGHHQCTLYQANHVPTAENAGRTNVTQLNGEPLHSPRPIKEGDRLKCGRVTLMVDSLYGSEPDDSGNLNRMTDFVNV